jgi:hypothetical protein
MTIVLKLKKIEDRVSISHLILNLHSEGMYITVRVIGSNQLWCETLTVMKELKGQ